MNQRTQIRAAAGTTIALGALLALLLVPTLACAGTETTGAPASVAQGDLIGMLPADAMMVMYFDYAALRETELYAELADELGLEDNEPTREFIARTGIDPRTDIHRAAGALGRISTSFDDDSEGGFIAVADFDRARLEESLAPHETTTYEGHTLWILRDLDGDDDDDDAGHEGDHDDEAEHDEDDAEHRDDDGLARLANEGAYLGILSDDTVVFGSRTMVQKIIDVRGGAASVRTNERLSGLIEDVDPDSEIWVVSAQDRLVADLAPGGDSVPMPQIPVDKIRSMILSVRLSDGLGLQLRGRTETADDAKLLGDSLNGMLAFGKMMLQSNAPEIFTILDRGVQAGSSGRDVTIRANLSADDLAALRDYAERTIQSEGEVGEE